MSSLSPLPLSGGRRSRHRRRHSKVGGVGEQVLPSGAPAGESLVTAGNIAKTLGGQEMGGGRRRKMTAKKMVKKLHVLAKQAKKLTMRLKKMKKHH
jgi:hypothetical protein